MISSSLKIKKTPDAPNGTPGVYATKTAKSKIKSGTAHRQYRSLQGRSLSNHKSYGV
nr:MAG TPA: hypothetical protein [Caudoviricetes sp.]